MEVSDLDANGGCLAVYVQATRTIGNACTLAVDEDLGSDDRLVGLIPDQDARTPPLIKANVREEAAFTLGVEILLSAVDRAIPHHAYGPLKPSTPRVVAREDSAVPSVPKKLRTVV